MKLIIAGSRSLDMMRLFNKKERHEKLEAMLDKITELVELSQGSFFEWEPVTEIISGKASGPDTVGEVWAMRNGLPVRSFPADWNTYGKQAGFIRNERMAKYADHAIILWDGKSTGSQDMLDHMRAACKEFIIEDYSRHTHGKDMLARGYDI